jgi:hypothetical protein
MLENIDGMATNTRDVPCAGSIAKAKTIEKIIKPAMKAMKKSAMIMISEDDSKDCFPLR